MRLFPTNNARLSLLTSIPPPKPAKTVRKTKSTFLTWKSVSRLFGYQTSKPSMSFSKNLTNSSKLISIRKRPTLKEQYANAQSINLWQSTILVWPVLLKRYSTSHPSLAKMGAPMVRYLVNRILNALMPLSLPIQRLLIYSRLWGILKSSEQPKSKE